MRTFIVIFFLLISLIHVQSQSDSLAFVTADWKTEVIDQGVVWKSFHFKDSSVFNSKLHINIIEFKPYQSAFKLRVVTSDSLQLTSELVKVYSAIAGINGSFFRTRYHDAEYPEFTGTNRSVVYMMINGEKITDNILEKDSKRKNYQKGAIVIKDDNVLILKAVDSLIAWEVSIEGLDILTSGPMLLNQSVMEFITDIPFNMNRHPRTAIGKKPDGNIVLFVADGRSPSTYGLTIPELQLCMRWLGCSDALNLDGGGSSTMVVDEQDNNGVVNCPSDNKIFDHGGEREVANAILIVKSK